MVKVNIFYGKNNIEVMIDFYAKNLPRKKIKVKNCEEKIFEEKKCDEKKFWRKKKFWGKKNL